MKIDQVLQQVLIVDQWMIGFLKVRSCRNRFPANAFVTRSKNNRSQKVFISANRFVTAKRRIVLDGDRKMQEHILANVFHQMVRQVVSAQEVAHGRFDAIGKPLIVAEELKNPRRRLSGIHCPTVFLIKTVQCILIDRVHGSLWSLLSNASQKSSLVKLVFLVGQNFSRTPIKSAGDLFWDKKTWWRIFLVTFWASEWSTLNYCNFV